MTISHAALQEGLRRPGPLSEFLLARIDAMIMTISERLGETFFLGDLALGKLTALRASFDADPALRSYTAYPTPTLSEDGHCVPKLGGRAVRIYTSIDARRTFNDLLAKFRSTGDLRKQPVASENPACIPVSEAAN